MADNLKQRHFGAHQQMYLHQLGLSQDAIHLYKLLLDSGGMTAHEASTKLGKFSSAEYRLFYKLEDFGLVRRLTGRPLRFVAIPPENAFVSAQNVREHELRRALHTALGNKMDSQGSAVRLVMGRQALYEEYIQLAQTAKHSMDAFTIGIAHSPELVATQRDMAQRGVAVRLVLQQVKLSNYYVVRTWQKLGIEVRKHISERGLHLMLFDSHTALVSFSSPADTDDRVSLVLTAPAAIALFRRYFEHIWNESIAIED